MYSIWLYFFLVTISDYYYRAGNYLKLIVTPNCSAIYSSEGPLKLNERIVALVEYINAFSHDSNQSPLTFPWY